MADKKLNELVVEIEENYHQGSQPSNDHAGPDVELIIRDKATGKVLFRREQVLIEVECRAKVRITSMK